VNDKIAPLAAAAAAIPFTYLLSRRILQPPKPTPTPTPDPTPKSVHP
jgi:hypothetical protein